MGNALAIIGAGRVGRALGRQLRQAGWEIRAVVTRSEASARRAARFIGEGTAMAGISRRILVADVVLIATPDAAIPEVAAELARIGGEELRGKVALHTSGALDSGALEPLRQSGAATGSMHPMQTFSGVGMPKMAGKLFAIEGDPQAVRVARRIARSMGGAPMRIEAPCKPLYHAAGAMAAGHVLAIMEAATRLQMSTGMKRREVMRALLGLTRQVLDNYERLGPAAAWTGPLSRGDHGVIAAHIEALERFSPSIADGYRALNRMAIDVLGQGEDARGKTFADVVRNGKSTAAGSAS